MRTLALLLTTLFAAPAAAQDIPDTGFDFGLWRGAAHGDATGAFTHCYATLAFASGDQIWINVTPLDRVDVIFRFAGRGFAKDETFEASLMLESGTPTYGTAHAIDAEHVSFSLIPISDAHVFLAHGSFLRLLGVGRDETYEVRGLGGALGLARTCLADQAG